MKYPDRGNRVYRVDEGGEHFHYIAPDAAAAITRHRELHEDTNDLIQVVEVPPDQQVRVTFDDACEGIATAAGLSPTAKTGIRRLLRAEKKQIDGTLTIGRAAEQWARSVPNGRVEQLSSSVF